MIRRMIRRAISVLFVASLGASATACPKNPVYIPQAVADLYVCISDIFDRGGAVEDAVKSCAAVVEDVIHVYAAKKAALAKAAPKASASGLAPLPSALAPKASASASVKP